MVMVGIVPSRYSYGLIKETGVFVANLAPESMCEAFDYLGSHSGRDEDKFARLGLRLGEGMKVNAPILLDCPVSIECTVVDSIRTGSHEMFVGRIEYVHADEALVGAEGKMEGQVENRTYKCIVSRFSPGLGHPRRKKGSSIGPSRASSRRKYGPQSSPFFLSRLAFARTKS
jgi:flavin reductase (DIM6/NTAB) family NADH-FMN oxidoreductase RutF